MPDTFSRSTDAGPDTRVRRRNPNVYIPLDWEPVDCAVCPATPDRASSYRCQGSHLDRCITRCCEGCVVKCYSCNGPVCEEHRRNVADGIVCDNCRVTAAKAELMASQNALEAVA